MKPAYAGSIAIILALFVIALHADEPTAQPAVPPSLEGVTWAGPGVALGDLRGKSVVILVYVTKYQLAVDWPTQLLAELKLAAEGKPVVILAINTDKKAELDLAYMNARAFNGPNILHGRDPLLPARLGLASRILPIRLDRSAGQGRQVGQRRRPFQRRAGAPLRAAAEDRPLRGPRRLRDRRRADAGEAHADALAL